MKYIEEELRKRRGLLNPDGTEGAEKSEMEQLAESLYDTPANLAVRQASRFSARGRNSNVGGESN